MERLLAMECASSPCQVWQVDIGHAPSSADAAVLCADETARAMRFVFEVDRHRFINCRSALRRLLALETGRRADALQIRQGTYGKPLLVGEGPVFNVSHCADLALIAIASAPGDILGVGVDLELSRDVPDALALAPMVFTAQECEELQHLGDSERPRAFLTAWTRKEAYLKALGTGLANFERIWTGMGADALSIEHAWPTESGSARPARIDLTTHALGAGKGIWSLALWRAHEHARAPGSGGHRIMETTA